jgi:hypothetical protein
MFDGVVVVVQMTKGHHAGLGLILQINGERRSPHCPSVNKVSKTLTLQSVLSDGLKLDAVESMIRAS